MSHKVNLVRVLTAATGNSTPITLGTAYSQLFMTPAEAGAMNGRVYTYLIVDGNDWEMGKGAYTSSGTTLARTTVLASRISGTLGTSRISLSGTAQVRFIESAEDMDGIRGTRAVTGTSDVIANSDQGYAVTYSNAASIAVTLAQASASNLFLDGWATTVQNLGAGTVTITPATSTINGGSTLVLAQNMGAFIWSDGTNYHAAFMPVTKPLLAGNNLSDLADADTALDNLGGTTVGKAVFTAVDAAAARTALAIQPGMSDTERQSAALDRIYQSKLLGSTRRVVNAWADGFKDSDGINAGSSSGYTLDAANGILKPTISIGSLISRTAGTAIGSMIGSGGLSAAFDGTQSKTWASSATQPSGGAGYVGKNFSTSPKQISQINVYGTSDTGFDGTGAAQTITITIYAKNGSAPGSGTDGTVIGTLQSFSDSNSLTKTFTSTDPNTAWDYVWAYTTTTAGAQGAISQVEFYASSVSSITVVTTSQTADASTSNVRALLEFDNTATPTLNTDLTVEVTCNGGTNWEPATLSAVAVNSQGGRLVAETADTACTSGTSIAARIKTANGKNIPIYGGGLIWH